jgi:uncharacterized protein YehS (DUF1456 family)
MQKRKIPKNTLPDEFIQDAISGMIMEEVGITPESVTGMVSAICNNSIELSKVVIENRVRNSDKLNDTDIYNIYKESSIVVAQAVELQGK